MIDITVGTKVCMSMIMDCMKTEEDLSKEIYLRNEAVVDCRTLLKSHEGLEKLKVVGKECLRQL